MLRSWTDRKSVPTNLSLLKAFKRFVSGAAQGTIDGVIRCKLTSQDQIQITTRYTSLRIEDSNLKSHQINSTLKGLW
jgi:hypothetical protein